MNIFEYLSLDIDERINYKESTSKSIQDIYRDSEPPFVDKAYCDRKEIQGILGICSNTLLKYISEGLLDPGERCGKKRMHQSGNLNLLLKERAYTFRPEDFFSHLENYYLSNRVFYNEFGENFYERFDSTFVTSLTGVARIFKGLRERKQKIETWKTIEDLWRESESDISFEGFRNYFRDTYRDNCDIFIVTRNDNKTAGKIYKINPKNYDKVLESERVKKEILERNERECFSLRQIARNTGFGYMTIRQRVEFARSKGLIAPTRARDGNMIVSPRDVQVILNPDVMRGYTSKCNLLSVINPSELVANLDNVPDTLNSRQIRHLNELAGKGDRDAINVLLYLNEPLLREVSKERMFGYDEADKYSFAMTAFFEMVVKGELPMHSEERYRKISESVKNRRIEEKVSWLSFDKIVGNGDSDKQITLGDLLLVHEDNDFICDLE